MNITKYVILFTYTPTMVARTEQVMGATVMVERIAWTLPAGAQ